MAALVAKTIARRATGYKIVAVEHPKRRFWLEVLKETGDPRRP